MVQLSRYDGENALSVLRDDVKKFVVSPANQFGLGGFVFDIEGETEQRQESEVTDHFVEDNSVVQDHVAVRPKEVTLRGFVAELSFTQQPNPLTGLQQVVQKLTVLEEYLPPLTQAASFVQNNIIQNEFGGFEETLDEALNLWQLIKNLNPTASRQQQAYLYFSSLQKQRLLVSVQTPYEFLTNMVVTQVMARQSEDSDQISDFSITLKQIRLASTINVQLDIERLQSRRAEQEQETEERGKAQGEETSLAVDLVDGGTNKLKETFGF